MPNSLIIRAQSLREGLDVNSDFEITFLNKKISFSDSKIQWISSDYKEKPEKLWLYKLNYFDWLNQGEKPELASQKLDLILSWIENNPSSELESWEPYPLSKRITNWALWCDSNSNYLDKYIACISDSIFLQTKRLIIDLEYHNQANHLFENFKAIFVACAYLIRTKYKKTNFLIARLSFAALNLIAEINEQFFLDGGHYERSAMYHKELLQSVELLVIWATKLLEDESIKLGDKCKKHIEALLTLCNKKVPTLHKWLALMTHPDGKIAQFNDAILENGADLELFKPRDKSLYLEQSGYFVKRDKEVYCVISCKAPSPPWQPGHTHCDIMSYELSLNGTRFIIDRGCGSYQNQPLRTLSRSTSSHNLPLVELTEQSDIWGFFRIGKRAQIIDVFYSDNSFEIKVCDQHGQIYSRTVNFLSKKIIIKDRLLKRRLSGAFCTLIHLAPNVSLKKELLGKAAICTLDGKKYEILTDCNIREENYMYYPDFGREVSAIRLILNNKLAEETEYVIKY